MKVSYTELNPNQQIGGRIEHKLDLQIDEVLRLLEELKNKDETLIFVETDCCFLIFYWHEKADLWIEILDGNPSWIYSEVFLTEVEEILEIACRDGNFGCKIPTTNEVWDAYNTGNVNPDE